MYLSIHFFPKTILPPQNSQPPKNTERVYIFGCKPSVFMDALQRVWGQPDLYGYFQSKKHRDALSQNNNNKKKTTLGARRDS